MDALFTAFDISGLSTNLTAMYVGGIGLMLIGIGFKAIKKAGWKLI